MIDTRKDMVNHPLHYTFGKIEVIEAIEDWGLNFARGSVIKYTARAGRKDPEKEIEDLEKSVWYLKREIERLKAEKENRLVTKPSEMNRSVEKESRDFSATSVSNSSPIVAQAGTVPNARKVEHELIIHGKWAVISHPTGFEEIVFIPFDQTNLHPPLGNTFVWMSL